MTSAPSETPYLRIASDLRRRIHDGSLRPGQRLPSTRRLAQSWKVALATAAKALGVLAREKLIFAVPRVGNVVANPPPPDAGRWGVTGAALNRAAIVHASIEMADREGFMALSMRGVAAKMGVPVTSLYRHVAGRDDLLKHMVDTVMQIDPHLAPARTDWRTRVETGARLEWQLARRHPWVARAMTLTRPVPTASSLQHAEWMLSALEAAGVDATTMMQMHVTIYGFVQGLASNLETEAQAEGETGLDEEAWMRTRDPEFTALAATGQFPTFARVLGGMVEGFDLDLDAIFEFGLARLLDGFAKMVEAKKGKLRAGIHNDDQVQG